MYEFPEQQQPADMEARVKLKWNNHEGVFSQCLQKYFNQSQYSDAMVACEGRFFMVHRIILSMCSQYFEEIFNHTPNDNTRPIIILNDIPVEGVEWLLNYMYFGEATVPKASLVAFFRLAEHLKVKGLSHVHAREAAKLFTSSSECQEDGTIPMINVKTPKRKAPGDGGGKPRKKTTSLPVIAQPETKPISQPETKAKSQSGIKPISQPETKPISQPETKAISSAVNTLALPSSSTMPLVAVSLSSLPPGIHPAAISNWPSAPTCASHLSKQSTPSPSLSTGKQNSDTTIGKSSYSLIPSGTFQDLPLLVDIKEEVKEEPLTLGPDDPMIAEDEDDDDFMWSISSNSAPLHPGMISPQSVTSPVNPQPQPVTSPINPQPQPVTSPVNPQPQHVSISPSQHNTKTKKVMDSEQISEGTSRSSHILPQILTKPAVIKPTVIAKAKDNKMKKVDQQLGIKSEQAVKLFSFLNEKSSASDELSTPWKGMNSTPKTSPKESNSFSSRIGTLSNRSNDIINPSELTPNKESSLNGSLPLSVAFSSPTKNYVDTQNHLEEDSGLREAVELIKDGEVEIGPKFTCIESNKKRNQPYMMVGTKIAAKNFEPIKFSLKRGKENQTIKVSMRYTEEKYRHIPVYPCPLHIKEIKANFEVSSSNRNLVWYTDEESHPTAHVVVENNNKKPTTDFLFYVTFLCLNSCHKNNGKKLELIFRLFDTDAHDEVLTEKKFEIRVCKNIKRDYKDVFQAEQGQGLKFHVLPDSFLYPDEVLADHRNAGKGHDLASVSDPLSIEESQQSNEIMSLSSQQMVMEKTSDYYVVRLPNSKRGRMVLDFVQEFEKNLEIAPEDQTQETAETLSS